MEKLKNGGPSGELSTTHGRSVDGSEIRDSPLEVGR